MEKLIINGGKQLYGTISVGGAKNAVLPIIAATLLTDKKCTIQGVPKLTDVYTIGTVLSSLGAEIHHTDHSITVTAANLTSSQADYQYVRRMRASFLVMGPLLARTGKAIISLPGGCAIGTRPIDLHLKGFAALGANITYGQGFIEACAKELVGNRIYLDFPSVGATENIMMAASLANGTTILENAAEEPEIVDLANFLNSMGAKVKGAGTKIIRIEGQRELGGTSHQVIPDRIEAGTYLAAVAMTGGDVVLQNVIADHLKPVVAKLAEAGAEIQEGDTSVRIISDGKLRGVDIKTLPYPGFPTDMQAQMMALMTMAQGTSVITETVFENRFMHVNELKRMGAKIKIEGHTAIIEGVDRLSGAQVKATDLRAGAALIIAGLAADGQTIVTNLNHIDRGYYKIEEKLRTLGADITRVESP